MELNGPVLLENDFLWKSKYNLINEQLFNNLKYYY